MDTSCSSADLTGTTSCPLHWRLQQLGSERRRNEERDVRCGIRKAAEVVMDKRGGVNEKSEETLF